jgi:hypothetical protein
MPEEEKDVNQDSSPEDGADLLEGLEPEDNDDSEVEKTPAEKVEPEKQPKSVPYERFKKVVEDNKSLKNRNIQGTNPMEVVKLAKALEGYSEDEVDFITRNSKSAKIDDIIAVTKDEWVQDAIAARRKKVADSKKVPGSSSSDFASNVKSPKEIAEMKPEERAEYEEMLNRESTGI